MANIEAPYLLHSSSYLSTFYAINSSICQAFIVWWKLLKKLQLQINFEYTTYNYILINMFSSKNYLLSVNFKRLSNPLNSAVVLKFVLLLVQADNTSVIYDKNLKI